MSVGPRTDVPAPEARPATVAQAPVPPPPPPPAAPPTAPPVPPGQRGRFIVLNFDNADIETVIHAASEIVGFNYVLGPGVTGKKVTVQTSGRIPQEDVFGVLLAILEVHGVTAVRSGNLYKIVPVEGARERAVPTIVGRRRRPQSHARRDRHADHPDPVRRRERAGHAPAPAHLGARHADRQPRDGHPHHHRLGVEHRPPARHHQARRRRGGAR